MNAFFRNVPLCLSTAILCLLLLAPALSQADPEIPNRAPKITAIELLQNARTSAGALRSIYYEASLKGEGKFGDQLPAVEGRVFARNGAQDKFYMEGISNSPQVHQNGSFDKTAFKYLSDGTTTSVQYDSRKVFLTGAANLAEPFEFNALSPKRFINDEAYREELTAAIIDYQGMQDGPEGPCHVLNVSYDRQGRESARFFFDADDFLVRRIERPMRLSATSSDATPDTMLVFSVQKLRIDPEMKDAFFSLDCPAGYEKRGFLEPPGPPTRRPGEPIDLGHEAPDFVLRDSNNKEVKLRDLRGKVVVLDFWATWCGPCKLAMPGIQKLHDRFKNRNDVLVYGVNCWERNRNLDPMDYIRSKNYTYGQLLNAGDVATNYGVRSIPTIIAIGKDGKVIHVSRGFNASLEHALGALIDQNLAK